MSLSSGATPVAVGRSLTQATRAALIALVVMVLAALAFGLLRVMVGGAQPAPAIAPASSTHVNNDSCRVGLPC